ncbi:hypothetical protein [Desulfovibrio sp. TomC]|uniref:hypothetical protein n=1 Tax=Desulfovibrio sp. TomC TaxID=1562888 RepID=UPI000575261E|nr:hypothetical protein [Desulfovibrio sp. TomC]KHK03851.1 hypothetical protein NY78_0907 [Desulfovibrio sp. TomC]
MKRIALALAALAMTALCLEGVGAAWMALAGLQADALRLDLLDRSGGELPQSAASLTRTGRSQKQGYMIHPYLGFVYDGRDSKAVNSQGLIGPDLLDSASPDAFNVVITGGSVAGDFFVLEWDALRQAVAALPGTEGRTVKLFCLAVAGYKQPQSLLAVAYLLSQGAKIDLLINIDGFNEVVLPGHDLVPAGISPAYPMFWRDLTDDFVDAKSRKLLGRLALWDELGQTWAKGAMPFSFSRTALVLWHLGDNLLKRGEDAALTQMRDREAAPLPSPAGVDPTISPEAVQAQAADIWLRSSLALAKLGHEAGFAYLHVLQPNQYPEGAKPLSAWEQAKAVSPDPAFGEAVRSGYRELDKRIPALRQAGVAFEDATRLFADTPGDVFRDTCCHFNEAGNALLATRVIKRLPEVLTSPTGPAGPSGQDAPARP